MLVSTGFGQISISRNAHKCFGGTLNRIFPLIITTLLFWSCEDKTKATQELDAIVISPARSILQPGQTVQFSALVIDKSNSSMDLPVTWSTTSDQVATISKDGLVTAVGQGEAKIYATIDNVQGMSEVLVSDSRRRVLSEMFTSST
ncbi:MAG: Ig-like domain-containing protein [Candidatus Marinimicrobia bacterium]|nr:Ig-like domain-containing protein [Candidatus Neomarinimicrobiota bacterium]